MNNKFVLVIDVQQYWTNQSLSKNEKDKMIKSINALIDISDPEKVVYVKSYAKALSVSLKGFKTDTLPNQQLDKELHIVNNRVYVKSEGDAFAENEISGYLNQNNAKVIITGLLAEKCIFKTAMGGLSRNYAIYLVPNAIGGKSDKSKNQIIEKLLNTGAKVIEETTP
jgi:nicotinamidase-related amidase